MINICVRPGETWKLKFTKHLRAQLLNALILSNDFCRKSGTAIGTTINQINSDNLGEHQQTTYKSLPKQVAS